MSDPIDKLVTQAVAADELLGVVLSKPCRGCVGVPAIVRVRPVTVRGRRMYQFASQTNGQETHENLEPATTVRRVVASLGTQFQHAHLMTVSGDYFARLQKAGAVKITRSAPSRTPENHLGHDRTKQRLIPEGQPCAFLEEIGVMTAAGQVRASRRKKFRQVNRYLELVDDIVPDLPPDGPLHIVDFGCGKSYLTFALHHLLSQIHQREVYIVGLDRKSEVLTDCRRVARKLGLAGIEFREGDIAGHVADTPVHLAVSLHACDTATDDALAQAMAWDADVILAVPCCQHELAAKLGPNFLPPVQQHGILKDRLAAVLTDALRAKVLELCGYKTQVVEFIDLEHTAKNVLIRAVRRSGYPPNPAATATELAALKSAAGLGRVYLEEALQRTGVRSDGMS